MPMRCLATWPERCLLCGLMHVHVHAHQQLLTHAVQYLWLASGGVPIPDQPERDSGEGAVAECAEGDSGCGQALAL